MRFQRDPGPKVRLGVVGAGTHCYRNILPTLTYLPVELVAVADVDAERARVTAAQYGARASYTSARAMYDAENLDAVLICVSAALHPPLAIEALGAGLHVWLEKPAAVRAAQVGEMIAARGDLVCVVGYKKVFMPAMRKTQELLALQVDAPLRSVFGVYPISVPPDGSRVLERNEPNNWLNNGCHPLAAMLAIGGTVESVATIRGRHGGGACILHFANGAIGNLHLAEGAPKFQPFERYTAFVGDTTIEIENTRRVIYQRGIATAYGASTTFAPPGLEGGAVVWEAQDGLNTLENKAVFTQGIFDELKHFLDAVLTGTQPTLGTLEFALHLSQLYEASLLSSGQPVRVAAHA